MNGRHRQIFESGHDRMAEQYLITKDPEDPLALAALEETCQDLRPGAPLLDLGCGAGVPVTLRLAGRGFDAAGMDVSRDLLVLGLRLDD